MTAEGLEEDKEVVHKDEEPTLHEIRSTLVEIQITVADIQRKHNLFVEEIATLRNSLKSQKSEHEKCLGGFLTLRWMWFNATDRKVAAAKSFKSSFSR